MQNQSLAGIEEELARTDQKLATIRETLKRSHRESAADAAALREMGARTKEIMNRPKTWKGGSKRSDAAELERLRAEIKSRSETASRMVETMKSMSAEATALSKRQQDLSKQRADLVARGETTQSSVQPWAPPAAPTARPPVAPVSSVFRQAPGKPVTQPPQRAADVPPSPAPTPRRRRPLT